MPTNNDTALLYKVSTGDEKAFRQLFELYRDPIYSVAFAFTKSSRMAEEMVQDIFLTIWLKRNKLAGVERCDDYLFIIARNHIFNELRKKVKEEPFTEYLVNYFRETGSSPEQQLQLRETEQLVYQAVSQLPVQQRLVYSLSRRQGLTQEEIATQLDISIHTVKSHMNKALQFIRHYLHMHAQI